MNKRTVIVAVVVTIVAVVLAALAFSLRGTREKETVDQEVVRGAVGDISVTTVIPEKDTVDVPGNVARPEAVNPVGPGAEVQRRKFRVKVANNAFAPDTIIVRQGNVVRIIFSAVDASYDFVQPDYGLRMFLPRGQEKMVEFAAINPGQFTFFCERCGGPAEGPVGRVIVVSGE